MYDVSQSPIAKRRTSVPAYQKDKTKCMTQLTIGLNISLGFFMVIRGTIAKKFGEEHYTKAPPGIELLTRPTQHDFSCE